MKLSIRKTLACVMELDDILPRGESRVKDGDGQGHRGESRGLACTEGLERGELAWELRLQRGEGGGE